MKLSCSYTKKGCIVFFVYLMALSGCTAPRSVTTSGKVTPKGKFSIGFNVVANYPTATVNSIKEIKNENVKRIANNDSIHADDVFRQFNKASIANALDPVTVGNEMFIRYGVFKRSDIGYKRSSGVNIFDARYQFLGPIGCVDDPFLGQKIYGSVGLQYSSQKQSNQVPSLLTDIQSALGYTLKRSDILIPLIFSYSFGNEEKYGSVSMGLTYNYSRINYDSFTSGLYTTEKIKIFGVENNQSYSSFGGLINSKIGYKYVYLVGSISVYGQNYGNYRLLDGTTFTLKGVTIIPSIGVQVNLGGSKSKS
jgi:hypothetical protein